MTNILQVSHILQTKNEENTCEHCARQHAITTLSLYVCSNQIWQELSNLLLLTYYLTYVLTYLLTYLLAKAGSSHPNYLYFQTFDSFVFSYFNSNILCFIHSFCIGWFFVIDSSSNVLY